MKLFYCSVFVIISFYSNGIKAQNEQIFIEYDFYFYHHTGEFTIESISDAKENLQTVIRNYKLQSSPGVVENITEKKFIFKDNFKKNMIYQENEPETIVFEYANLMDWELTDEKSEVLGYQCNKAKVHFRGRDYIAYFTTELPFKTAPWKFHGLPGVVLKIYTDDGKLKINAKSIKIGKGLENVENPFISKKSITWEKFVKLYSIAQNKYLTALNALDAKNGDKTIYIGGRIDLITEADKVGDQVFNSNLEKVKQ